MFFLFSGFIERQKYRILANQRVVWLDLKKRELRPMTEKKQAARRSQADSKVEYTASLNFKVSPEFKKEFKGFAVAQDISMVELLKEGFELLKKERQK